MTHAQHTPGPWVATEAPDIMDSGGELIARCYRRHGLSSQENARLIAAAPELLAALEAMHACHRAFSDSENWTVLDDEARLLAEKAIAKAKGE